MSTYKNQVEFTQVTQYYKSESASFVSMDKSQKSLGMTIQSTEEFRIKVEKSESGNPENNDL